MLVRLERMAICLMLPGAVVLGEGLQTPNVPSRVEVVRVDVAVTDTKGRPVPDLSASDFEVREDGTPQTITSFAYVEVGTATSPPAVQPPSGERGILPAAPAPVSPRPRQRRIMAFVVDDLNLSRVSMTRVRDLLERFVEQSLQPVYTIDPRGVQPLDMDGGDFVTEPGFQEIIRDEMTMREASYELDHDGLERLAEATGGLFLHDTDPGKGLAQALRDQAGYYLLGFAATNEGGASYHRVSVKVSRPGLRVRARTGYWSGR